MSKEYFRNYKSTKVKLFLFFLFLAMIFWVLTKFSREFTTTMDAKIKYENLPETATLSSNNATNITFDLTANGFEILFYKFKKPKVVIDVSKYYTKEKKTFVISKTELLRKVSSNFNRNLAVKNLSVNQLNVHLDPIILKKVRVLAKTKISFKNGFKATDSVKVVPDSVTISGPTGSLKEIDYVETEVLTLGEVEQSISETAKIVSPSKEIVTINPKEVKVKIPVAEFSQGQFTLPVEVVNLPPDVNIKLIQSTVTVTFDISVKDFPDVSKNNFRVVCDYSKRNQNENFMLPVLEKKPTGALNIEFDPQKIDFLIFK